MNDTNNIHLNITDMSGHTFSIKLHWDIVIMKCHICAHYEEIYKNDFCNEKGITRQEFNTNNNYRYEWYNTDYYKTLNNMYFKLIYKGEILEQYHIETDLVTLADFQENSNINVVILNKYDDDDWFLASRA